LFPLVEQPTPPSILSASDQDDLLYRRDLQPGNGDLSPDPLSLP